MIYIAKRIRNIDYHNSALVFTSDNFLLEPFFGRETNVTPFMPFDWGQKNISFSGLHLAVSILANYWRVKPKTQGFFQQVKPLATRFYFDFLAKNFRGWEIEDTDIQEWFDELYEIQTEQNEARLPVDTREITFSVVQRIEPNYTN